MLPSGMSVEEALILRITNALQRDLKQLPLSIKKFGENSQSANFLSGRIHGYEHVLSMLEK